MLNNKIIVKYCILYCKRCQDNRNKAAFDDNRQAVRIRIWYTEEFREARREAHLQMLRFINKYQVDLQNENPRILKKQTCKLKAFKMKLEKCARNDIR